MAKKINVTYFDNFDYDFKEYKSYYQDFQELTDEEMAEVSDSEIYDFIYHDLDLQWDDFCSNLKYCHNNEPCVITGSLGLWTGRHGIEPTCCSDLESAIKKCVDNMDYCIIKQVCGHLEVTCIHHDGRNTFEIHLLNDKGVDAMYRLKDGYGKANLECRCYHKALKDYLF